MKIKINIDKTQLEFDGRDYKETVKDAGAFSQAGRCGICKSEHVAIDYRSAKGKEGTDNAGKTFDYFAVKCLDCSAIANFGEYQTGGFFLKKWEKYERPQAPQTQHKQQTNDQKNAPTNDEIPF